MILRPLLLATLLSSLVAPARAALVIRDDATGGDCTAVASWNPATRTCRLTADLSAPVVLESDGLILDGAGFEISGTTTTVGVSAIGRSAVTVRGARITGCHRGVELLGGSGNRVEGCVLSSNRTGLHVEGSTGVDLAGNTIQASNNAVILLGSAGAELEDCRITDNTINGTDSTAVYVLHHRRTVLQGNTVRGSQTIGVYLGAGTREAVVEGNDLSENGWYGLEIAPGPGDGFGNRVEHNVFSSNERWGATWGMDPGTTDAGDVFRQNLVTGNGGPGGLQGGGLDISNGGGLLVEENSLSGNGVFGGIHLQVTRGNVVRRNVVSGNTRLGIYAGSTSFGPIVDNRIDENHVLDNGGVGIEISGFGAGVEDRTLARGNTLSGNHQMGIRVSDGHGTRIEGNQVLGTLDIPGDGSLEGDGISAAFSTQVTVLGNTVLDSDRAGITLVDVGQVDVRDNEVLRSATVGVQLVQIQAGVVNGNRIADGRSHGLWLDLDATGLDVRGNAIENNAGIGIFITRTSGNQIFENRACGNGTDIQAVPGNTGDENQCTVASGWNDEGAVGCTRLCVEDLDQDGVIDAVDACPDTAPGATVDALGCSDAQVDADGDGYCRVGAPSGGPGGCAPGDCNDAAPAVHPGATEVCNGIDDDCNLGNDDVDADEDGLNDCTSDLCLDSIPDTMRLRPRQYGQVDGDPQFEIGPRGAESSIYTMELTHGCTCSQILAATDVGEGHAKKGCSPGLMERWTGVSSRPDRHRGDQAGCRDSEGPRREGRGHGDHEDRRSARGKREGRSSRR